MNFLVSIIYAPIVIYLLNSFDIKTTSIYICIVSFIWIIFLLLKKQFKEIFFPIVYLFICLAAFYFDNSFTLKLTPFIISTIISTFILYSFISKNSFIFIFLQKFKIEVSDDEKNYIHKSTLFWFIFSIINVCIHITILYINDENYWMVYSSLGWYFVFIVAAVIQFLHRKFVFLKALG